jgi:hypothetical protein
MTNTDNFPSVPSVNVEINVSNYCDLIDKKNFLNAFPFG